MEEITMRKSVVFLFIAMLTAMLNGCIISKSPSTPSETALRGSQKTFNLVIFPPFASYVWTLDGEQQGNTTDTYQYTPSGGSHELTVTATHFLGTDTQTWSILDAEATASVGAEGAIVAVADTDSPLVGAAAEIPSGALDTTVTVTINQTEAPSGLTLQAAGLCVEFGPTGTQFTSSVTLALPYYDTDNDGIVDGTSVAENQVKAYYYNESISTWEEVDIIDRDADANVVYISVTHFSEYITAVHQITIKGSRIAAGYAHSVVIKTDGSLWAWGNNMMGQLGDGTTEDKLVPTRIGTDTDWAVVSAGGGHNAALKTDGSLWAWGRNEQGQLGDGTTENKLVPTQIGSDTDWIMVAAISGQSLNESNTIALKTDGSLWAWGFNGDGMLGDGTTEDKLVPTRIGTDTDWAYVVHHWQRQCLAITIKINGSLWICGARDEYGAFLDKLHIGTDTDLVIGAFGIGHFLGIKADGSLWAFGVNNDGELGDGTTEPKSVLTQIGADTDWVDVTAGFYNEPQQILNSYSIAIKSDGSLWAWGYNGHGELGDGTTTGKYVPTRIGTDNDWARVAAAYCTIAIKTDGSLWAWGYNQWGQIGDGTKEDKLVPTRIGIDTDW
jgi:alpha-tubulin suppressor-like RCC1 family protein